MQGAAGARGPPGRDGQDGHNGLDGDDGPRGPRGQQGLTGPQGERGERGECGEHGEQGQCGPPGPPGPSSTPDGLTTTWKGNHLDGIDWHEHRINPLLIEDEYSSELRSIRPWNYPRHEVNSSVNWGIPFKAFISPKDKYLVAIDEECLGSTEFPMKNFMLGFPKLPKNASESDVFDFLSNIIRYGMGTSVYVPPPHTMLPNDNRGAWYQELPLHCCAKWEYYDGALRQCLSMSGTNLAETEFVKEVLYEGSGYTMIWRLAYLARHPQLAHNMIEIAMPTQRGVDSFLDYRSAWKHCPHVSCVRGIFCSDRYFVECFIKRLHPAHNSRVKPLMFHLVQRHPVNQPLPRFFNPDEFPSCVCSASTQIGIRGLATLHTPKDFISLNESRSSPSSSTPVRSLETDTSSFADIDIRQMDISEEDACLVICSLVAASPRSCDFCGATDHLVSLCPKLKNMASDPTKATRVLKAIESARVSGGGTSNLSITAARTASTGSSASRSRTPPTSNRSVLIRQMQEDDTDEDVSISRLTADEGNESDFH